MDKFLVTTGGVGGGVDWGGLGLGDGAERGDRGRDGDPGGLEGLGGMAEAVGAQAIADAVEIDDHRLQPGEVAHQVGPGRRETLGVEPALQVDLEAQGQEATDDVADHAVVALVEDRADLEGRLHLAERALDPPQGFVGLRDLGGGQVGASGEHELAIQPGLAGDCRSSRLTPPLAILR